MVLDMPLGTVLFAGLKPTCAAKGREKNEDRLAREQALDGHWPRTETT